MSDNGIVCKGVKKKFGDLLALKGVDLTVEKGDFLALFGPNGAGKTTLVKILCGLLRPTSGVARVAGHEVHETNIRKKVGVISHRSFLYDDLTAHENLEFYGELYGVANPAKKADNLLKQLELFDRRDDRAGTFSRGMAQRLSIARALVADPEFIFLDEPFTGLDVPSATIFRELLKQLHMEGKTIIMISHDIGIGISVSTRLAILCGGKLVYDEKTEGKTTSDFKSIYLEKLGL
jgi:ABC-type multidrug transport system ATPase subunit